MPVRSVDQINITDFVNTGETRQMERYFFTLEVNWTDNDGVKHSHGPQQYEFPTDLASMPPHVRRRFAEEMITAVARVTLGIDNWDNYE